MRSTLFAVVVGIVAMSSSAEAAGRKAGEVSVDVVVRQWAGPDAPSVGELAAGAPVVGHEQRNGFVRITGAAKGWIPIEAFGRIGTEEDQRRKLLTELSAAANATSEPEGKTDADLMYDAVRQWRGGETADSATIDRVLARSKKEADRTRREVREKVKQMFWKDPFSDQPQKLILVRKEDRDRVDQVRAQRRSQPVEMTAPEVAQLRSELAAARAEAQRAKAELARVVAKYEALASRGASDSRDESGADDGDGVARHARRSHPRRSAEQMQALNSPAPAPTPSSEHKHAPSLGTWQAAVDNRSNPQAEVVPAATTTMPPASWRSNDPRGIIVVPIESPISITADKKKR